MSDREKVVKANGRQTKTCLWYELIRKVADGVVTVWVRKQLNVDGVLKGQAACASAKTFERAFPDQLCRIGSCG